MATIELDPGSSYPEYLLGASPLRRPLFPAIRWGAILGGVAVGVSVQLVLTLLGIATGLSATDVSQGEMLGAGPLLWAGISMLIAAFVGGYVAARMSGLKRKVDGVLHGIVAWAVTTLLFATLATSAGGSMLSSIFNNMSQGMARSSATAGGDSGSAMLGGLIGGNVGPAAAVDQAVSGSPQQASPQARASTERALGAASTAAWTVFLAVALSLALGSAGGILGAVGARRTSWTGRTAADSPAA